MTPLPAETLALSGIAAVALFGAWKMSLQPRLERRRAARATSSSA